jgi:hypothetical protein
MRRLNPSYASLALLPLFGAAIHAMPLPLDMPNRRHRVRHTRGAQKGKAILKRRRLAKIASKSRAINRKKAR